MTKGSKLHRVGVSGKVTALIKTAQDICGPDGRYALLKLKEILDGKDPKARTADRIRCAEVLLERGWGKAIDTHAIIDLTRLEADRGNSVGSELLENWIRQLNGGQPPKVIDAEVVQVEPAGE